MKNVLRYAIVVIILGTLIVAYYFYLTRNTGSVSEESATSEQLTEMTKVTTKDFSRDYPATPREVIKWYNRILKLYYDPATTDEDLEKLMDQARMLFDEELLSYNPEEAYEASVKLDVASYSARERYIINTDVSDTYDVAYKKIDGDEIAYVVAYYFMKDGSGYTSTYQKYALRQDDADNWKILGFEMCDKDGDPIR